MVTLAEALQSLELVHGLIELTVDRRLIPQDFVDRSVMKRPKFREGYRFMLRSDPEPPVFLGDLLNQYLLQRAYRFQILVQASEQTSELPFAAGNRGECSRK